MADRIASGAKVYDARSQVETACLGAWPTMNLVVRDSPADRHLPIASPGASIFDRDRYALLPSHMKHKRHVWLKFCLKLRLK